jgi:hypothetical protein
MNPHSLIKKKEREKEFNYISGAHTKKNGCKVYARSSGCVFLSTVLRM